MITADEITAGLEAGREFDALVAEYVMGWSWRPVWIGGVAESRLYPPPCSGSYAMGNAYPEFSTDIADAWTVVENLAARGWKVDVQNRYAGAWACHVTFSAPDYRHVFLVAESAPLAICRAAIAAIETLPGDPKKYGTEYGTETQTNPRQHP